MEEERGAHERGVRKRQIYLRLNIFFVQYDEVYVVFRGKNCKSVIHTHTQTDIYVCRCSGLRPQVDARAFYCDFQTHTRLVIYIYCWVDSLGHEFEKRWPRVADRKKFTRNTSKVQHTHTSCLITLLWKLLREKKKREILRACEATALA